MLRDKTAIVACSRSKAGGLISGLEELGAHVALFEAIQIRAVEDRAPLQGALRNLDEYDWLVFTSGHAVDCFAGAMTEAGRAGLPPSLRVCAVGPATAERARAAGYRVDLVPERFVGEEAAAALVSALRGATGGRVLFPRARVARDVIPEALENAGARVDVIPVYETVAEVEDATALDNAIRRKPDLVVFTSSSTVTSFISTLGEKEAGAVFAGSVVAAIGPVTAATLAGFGKVAEIVPAEHTVPGLIAAIAAYFSR